MVHTAMLKSCFLVVFCSCFSALQPFLVICRFVKWLPGGLEYIVEF